MVDSARSFIEHVGHVLFPRGPKDLTDLSRCPACFVALPGSLVCASCGLDLNHPEAALLREASLAAAGALDARLELIGKIRFETAAERTRVLEEKRAAASATAAAIAAQTASRAQAHEAASRAQAAEAASRATAAEAALRAASLAEITAASASALAATHNTIAAERSPATPTATTPIVPVAPIAPITPIAPIAPSAPIASPPVTTDATPSVVREYAPAGGAAPRTRSLAGIQVILLIVGVSLLSVGAIFFLIYAFVNFGLIWRSAIIAAITLASIAGATFAKHRGLGATAEALSALAVVLVALDIYAVRANELLVIGDSAGRIYWGAAMIIASLGFMLWHRSSKLVLVNVLAYAAFPPAFAILLAGLAAGTTFDALFIVPMTALSLASLIYVTARHDNYRGHVERAITLGYAALSLAVGAISAIPLLLSNAESRIGGLVFALGATAALHSVAARRAGFAPLIRNLFAAASGTLIASALWNLIVFGFQNDDIAASHSAPVYMVVAPLAILAVLGESSGRNRGAEARSTTFWASIGVWGVTVNALFAPFVFSLAAAAQFTYRASSRADIPANSTFSLPDSPWPQLALLSIPIILTLGWLATGQLRARIYLVLAAAGAALALGAPLANTLAAVIAIWLALTATAILIIWSGRKRRGSRTSYLIVGAGGTVTLILAYASGWSSYQTWLLTSIATGALLFAARYLITVPAIRAAMLSVTTLIYLIAAAGIGEELQIRLANGAINPLESWITVSLLAAAIFIRSLWPRTREINTLERRVLWWIGFTTIVLACIQLWFATFLGAPFAVAPLALNLSLISLIVAVVFVAVASATMLSSGTRRYTVERVVAAASLAPATVWAVDSATRTLGLSNVTLALAPATASILVAAFAMTLRVRKQHLLVRRTSELSALTVAAITTASALIQPQSSHWLIVLFVSITLLLASISADGIFGSQSLRRHIIWGAVAFATWALWLRLDQNSVEALEAYVLPLAAVVFTISIFTARAELRHSALRSAPAIALVGLLIAILPLSLNSASASDTRAYIIAGLCGALLLVATLVRPLPRLLGFWGVAIVASATGLAVATAARAIYSIGGIPSALPEAELWLLGAFAIMTAASFGLKRSGFLNAAALSRWARTSTILLGSALTLLYVVETIILLGTRHQEPILTDVRILALTLLGTVLVILGTRFTVSPLTRNVGYLAFALAAALGLLAFAYLVISPSEWWLTSSILALGLLLSALLAPSTADAERERRMMWLAGFGIAALAGANLWNANVNGFPLAEAFPVFTLQLGSLTVASIFVASLLVTMLRRATPTHVSERMSAALVLAPAVVWALDSAIRTAGLGTLAIELAPASATVLVAALSMTLRIRQRFVRVRILSEISALVVAAVTTASTVLQPHDAHWLIALFIAIALLLSAISADGIFGSQSPRRLLIWGAVTFATWALWLRLDQSRVEALEAYVLPLAGLVLAIAILTARAELQESRLRSAPQIALASLLIAIVPLALNAASGTGLSTLIITGLCAALLLAASFIAPRASLFSFWGIAIVASAAGLITATTARALYSLASAPSALPEAELLLVSAVVLMTIASYGIAFTQFSRMATTTLWAKTSAVLLGAALVLLYVVETFIVVNIGDPWSQLNQIRLVALVILGAALLVANARFHRQPLTRNVAYIAFTLAAILPLTTYVDGYIQPLELWLSASILGVGLLTRALMIRSAETVSPEPRALWLTGFAVVVVAGGYLWIANLSKNALATTPLHWDLQITNVVGALIILAILSFTLFTRGTHAYILEGVAAAAVLAPATVWALDSAARILGFNATTIELAPATASVLIGVFSLVLRSREYHPAVRRASEISALTVAAITTISATFAPHQSHWLIVLFVSITLLLSSIARDGVFGSVSSRRHIIWGAVAFGTWALWLRLDQARVDSLEAYVLPLAAIVIAISIFTGRAELRASRLSSAPAITLAGLLIAILPLALNAASGDGLRTLVIAGLCGALLLTAAFVEPPPRLVDFWGVAIIASALGLIVTTASRAIVIIVESRSALPELDSWLLGAVAVLALAAYGAASTGFSHDNDRPRWSITSEILLGSAIVLLYAIETLVLLEAGHRDQPLDTLRIVVLVALGSALLVLASRPSARPLTHRLSYLAFGLASLVGAITFFGNLVQPLEWVTVLLGAALLAFGGLRMTQDPEARSVRWLSTGLIVVLAPSLIATFIDTDSTDTAWRIVALGIVSVVIILVGAWLKLKAPLIIATVVVLIHASHTFAPTILSLYQATDWWMWAVIGGAIVLFLGITLERRIRDLKTLNTRFSALR